ncbi:hypothetical protein EVU96_09000 [Bacillus infantis]|uniref:hypothetical protein n=1 Tax=Bacillus infantis TaxID=324767 RepID=UPI00101E206B|nr:hypothetical protein [Bacillus infantis]RYI30542.1 hypothetical protein EVU96_09000 [Bacillus infantis]
MKCIKLGCNNEVIKGKTSCDQCLKPYYSYGVIVNPPDIGESTYEEIKSFFGASLMRRRQNK